MKTLLSAIFFLFVFKVSGQHDNLQDLLNNYKDSVPNYGIVGLIDNGTTSEKAAIGWAYENTPMQTNSKFCIGSVTKLFTSTLILKLQEEGLLNIKDPISNYIPKHAFIDGTITIEQLLNHTSGIKDIVTAKLTNAALLEPYKDYSDSYLYSLIDTVDFKKGTSYSYSNSNYFLLRKIIENVCDKPYAFALKEYILTPLNLKNTLPYHSKNINGLTHPIIENQDLHDIPKISINQISIGIGNIVSNLDDLNLFIRRLFIDQTILNSTSLKLMTNFKTFKNTHTGLGLFKETFGDKTVYGHTGRTISYISYLFVDVKNGRSYVLLCNNANDAYIDQLMEQIR